MSFFEDLLSDAWDAAKDVADDPKAYASAAISPITAGIYAAFRAGEFGKDQLEKLLSQVDKGSMMERGGGGSSASAVSPSLIKFDPISRKDINKTLIDPSAGMISDERMAQLMPDWRKDALDVVGWNEKQFGKVLDMAYSRAGQDAEWLNEMNRVEADKMNKFMAEQFYASMDEATPGLRSLTGKYQGTVSDMLSGELPASVRDQITRSAAERTGKQGLFGEAATNVGLRDLGLSSLDYIQKGQAQMPTMMGVAEAMRAPQIQMSLADTGALASQYGSSLMGLTTMSPTAAVAAGAQQAQLGIGLETFNQQMSRSNQELNVNRIADWLRFNSSQGMAAQQFNAQMNYASALSNLNYSLDQQAFEWNYKTAQMQANSAERAGMWSGLTNLAGAGAGALAML